MAIKHAKVSEKEDGADETLIRPSDWNADHVPDYPLKLKPNLTRWTLPGWLTDDFTNQAVVADRIYYTPIFVEETTTYIRIGIWVGTGAEGTADLRIFNWDDGVPGSLLLSAGTVDTTDTGLKEIVISQQLARGYYFLAVRCSATPSIYGCGATTTSPVAGFCDMSTYKVPECVVMSVDAAYDDPAPAPTTGWRLRYAFGALREN